MKITRRLKPVAGAGFTLLELLVVLIIISVVVSGAMLAIGDPAADTIKEENQRLMALIEMAQEQAILQSRDIGIGFWQDGYNFMQPTGALNEVGEAVWQLLSDDILRQRALPEGMLLQLKLEGIEITMNAVAVDHPQVTLLSSGEISPFELLLTYGDQLKAGFSVDPLGTIELLEPEQY
ncbi:MAG: type II secretion system minor pseudopilin GspH [Gammaproteobacteria bacterium]|nr:type II secretion system minor pseudopilin GspH [Gammaproteobacteria bacterium]